MEIQNRRYKRIGILALLVMSIFTFMGQIPVNQEVRAQKFSLHDARGRTRAMLFSSEGQAILILADQEGEPRITLAVGADGNPALALADKGDKIRAELSTVKGGPRLTLYANDQKPRAFLTVASDGSPRLGMMDKNQSPRIIAGGSGEDWVVGVWDARGKLVGGLGENK